MNRDGKDRYGYEHRRESGFLLGESMPGTVGDSDGTLHDRLGGQPTVDLDELQKVTVPSDRARHRAEARQQAQANAPSARKLSGETVSIHLEEVDGDHAIGFTNGHRVRVRGGKKK